MSQKVVIITGASSGIGKSLAYEYAKKNFHVVIAARNIEKLKIIENDLVSQSIGVLSVQADVSVQQDCERIIVDTVAKFGRIDVLINNAGISMRSLFKDVDLSVIKRLMDVNFWGTVYCTKYALPYLVESKGSLVGVISIAGYLGLPARSGYSASKYAIRGFLDTLRVENLKTGLHVLVAAPGYTASNIRNTALTEEGKLQGESPRDESKMMTSEEVAIKIANAVDKRKAELILTFVEGKFSVFLKKFFPRLVEKLTYNFIAKEENSPFK